MRRSLFVTAIVAITIGMMAVSLVYGAGIAPAASGLSAPEAQIVLEPVTMSWVSSADPGTNYGGLGYFWVGYGNGSGNETSTLRGLVQFNLSSIPTNATITNARLYATIWDTQGPADHFHYCPGRSVAGWNEDAVTWNNKPGALYELSCTDISATAGQISWDMTSTVREMHGGLVPNNGFYLVRENDETDPQEHTRMFGQLRLVVDYGIATPTPTATTVGQAIAEISKSDSADPVLAGDAVVYTIRVRNAGEAPLQNLWLTDTIPQGVTFVAASGGGSFVDGVVSWEFSDLQPGVALSVDLALRTSPATSDGTVLTNQAEVGFACRAGGGNETIRICTETTAETTTVNQRQVLPPTPITCRLDEAGDSFGTATNLPLGASGVNAAICPVNDEDWFKFPVGANATIDGLLSHLPADYAAELIRPDGAHVATFNKGGLADEPIRWWGITPAQAGEWRVRIYGMGGAYAVASYHLTMQVHAPTNTPTSTPTRTGTPPPTNTPTPTASPTPTPTSTATTIPRPQLAVDLTLTSGDPIPGENVVYNIRVTNTGTTPVEFIHVFDSFSSDTTFQSASPDPASVNGQLIEWPVREQLNPGGALNYRVVLHLRPDWILDAPLENEAWVSALDVDRIDVKHSVIVSALPDLTISDAQVIQAIMPGDTEGIDAPVPLIEGKYTAVRVVINTGYLHSAHVPGVTGRLYYYHPGEDVRFVEPDNGPIVAPPQPNLANNDDTLNFFLPPGYLRGEVRWWVEVNTDHRVLERDYTNNRWPRDPQEKRVINFRPARTYRIGYVPIAWAATASDTKHSPSTQIETADWFLNRVFPVDLNRIDYYEAGMGGAAAFPWEGHDWEALIAELNNYWDMLELYTTEGAPDQLVGWLPKDASDYGGLSDPPWNGGRGLVVFADDDIGAAEGGIIAAHELGHNLGHVHPCENTVWPYPADYDIQTIGFDPYESHYGSGTGVINPATSEFMTGGWCGATGAESKWISAYSYKRLVDSFTPLPMQSAATTALTAQAGQNILLVSGAVRADRIDIFDAYRITSPKAVSLPRPDSGQAYCVALRDSGGVELDSFCFDMPDQGNNGWHSSASSSFSVPFLYQSDTAELVVYEQGGPRQARRTVSANDPQITAIFPNGGETITQPITATWQAADTDGDPLTYIVLYSADDGIHWQPLITGLKTPSFVLDPATLPGSDQARLRVVASDGIRTIHHDSHASFIVPTKPPRAHILTPRNESQTRAGEAVTLFARGFDHEDGVIRDDAAFTWHSSLDGPLGAGRSLELATLAPGRHTITLVLTDSDGDIGRDSIALTVVSPAPPPCQGHELLRNGGFEQSDLSAWHAGGAPQPQVVTGEKHSGDSSLLLGNPTQEPQQPTLSFVRQYLRVPNEATEATLNFWYKVRSEDPGQDYDWFGAYVLDPQGERAHQVSKVNANTGWVWTSYDLTEFRGQVVGVGFFVRNDGQGGATWAFVDDVSVCTDSATPPASEPNTCWLPSDLPDYAPSGLPDFDQRQSDWQTPDTRQWSYDAPTALANLLWWQDSAAEPEATAPPAISDGYNLVRAYGPWDDHAPQNVQPLIADLASRMFTDQTHAGSNLEDVVQGLNTYLGSMGLADDYTLTLRRTPSFDWVREEVKQQRQVMLMMGFWELQPGGWRRLGGHYTAVAGVSCQEDGITLSDPARNAAEQGWPGQMLPSTTHAHPSAPPDTTHNDAAYVAHDSYGIMRTTGGWGPQGYARQFSDVANFMGLNFAPALEPVRAQAYLGGEIVTMVDYVLVLSPRSDVTMLRLTPIDNHVRIGETFLVEIDVWPGAENVDSARTFLEFDPAVLQVVDAQGNPATAIAPGSTLATVVQNHVDNDNGRITYVATGAPGSERFLLATVRFKALVTSPESALNWSLTAPRQSDLFVSGTSVLDNASGGRVSIQPGAVAAGRALLQGRPTPPNPSWQTPLLVTLSRANEIGPAYLFGTMSDESGRFTIPGIVAPDAYRLRLKGLHTLRNLLVDTLSTGANSINMETLLEGDAWNDNRIDGHDISLLAATYGKAQGQAGYDPRADFNQDGSVNQADVSLLRENLGQQGDVLVGVSAAASNQDSTSLALSALLVPQTSAEATVSLSLTPTSTQSMIGDVIILDVLADAGGAQVDTAEVHVDFDPTLVQLVDANGDPATVIEPGAALPIVFQNRADPTRGHIDFIASSLGSVPASGQFTMARLRFRLVQTGETLVRFSFSHWRTTDVSYRGTSVLQGVAAAHINAAPAPLYLPVIRK